MDTKNLAVIGFGGRGHIYGEFARKYPEKFQLKAVAETDEYRRRDAKENFGAEVYENYKELLDQGYRLDLVAISTQDAQHKEHALHALNRGYDLLLEKPVAITEKDCLEIYECAKKNNRRVYVCHVLRYTPFYSKIKEMIDEGTLGEIVNVHASENVGYYHQAHSYVRGPWRNSGESSPMILAKCCHDMDILRYLIGEKCVSVNSYGSLSYFKEENAPENAAAFCTDCPRKEDCAYNAQKLYTKYVWPAGYFTKGALTEENILRDLKYSPYDRCVFKCDNDVVDHQVVNMLFEGGKTAQLTMTAFSKDFRRTIKVHLTGGEIMGDIAANRIDYTAWGRETVTIDVTKLADDLTHHCGGDKLLVRDFYDYICGNPSGKGLTAVGNSLESHLMAFAAEKSRLSGGEPVQIGK